MHVMPRGETGGVMPRGETGGVMPHDETGEVLATKNQLDFFFQYCVNEKATP
jgi:hypothetical protein